MGCGQLRTAKVTPQAEQMVATPNFQGRLDCVLEAVEPESAMGSPGSELLASERLATPEVYQLILLLEAVEVP